jgi:hypothetical protein
MFRFDGKANPFVLGAKRADDIGGFISRSIVYNAQFPMRIGLPLHRLYGVGDEPLHVVAWHDDGNKWLIIHEI